MAEAHWLRRAVPTPMRSGDHPAGTGSLPGWSTHPDDEDAVAATSSAPSPGVSWPPPTRISTASPTVPVLKILENDGVDPDPPS
jgi:hypothetical protein